MIRFPSYYKSQEKYAFAVAMHRFNQLPEMAPVRKWLSEELARLDDQNRSEPSEADFRQRQGACQTVKNFLQLATDASGLADDIKGAMIVNGNNF